MSSWSPTPAVLSRAAAPAPGPDPRLERFLRRWLGLGLLGVCLLPPLRGSSEWLGWWPLWLVAMPCAAWWALHRFQVPAQVGTVVARGMRRLRPRHQARRRRPSAAARRRFRVA